jgi:hypothetical protein
MAKCCKLAASNLALKDVEAPHLPVACEVGDAAGIVSAPIMPVTSTRNWVPLLKG